MTSDLPTVRTTAPTQPLPLDPVQRMDGETASEGTLVRLVACAAVAILLLALATTALQG